MKIITDISEEFSSKAIARNIAAVLDDLKSQFQSAKDMFDCTVFVAKEMLVDYHSFARKVEVAEKLLRP